MSPLLSVRDLTLLYGPEKGCQAVSFDLYPGEVLGIVGESGSGKSTLLSVLSGRPGPIGVRSDTAAPTTGTWIFMRSARRIAAPCCARNGALSSKTRATDCA